LSKLDVLPGDYSSRYEKLAKQMLHSDKRENSSRTTILAAVSEAELFL